MDDAMLDLVPTDDQGTIGDDAHFLGALSVLEQETATLTEQAAEADEFPAWLAEAAELSVTRLSLRSLLIWWPGIWALKSTKSRGFWKHFLCPTAWKKSLA